MKKLFTTFALSVVALAASAASNTGVPDVSVYPEPNSTVESISQIEVVTGFVLPRNHPVSIIFNGISYPVAAEYASDMESVTYTLETPITRNGIYEIVIPENSFGMGYGDEANPEITYKLTVDNPEGGDDPDPDVIVNQVPEGFIFTPAAGTEVEVLSTFSVSSDIQNFLSTGPLTKITINAEDVDVVAAISGEFENCITWTLAKPIAEPGYYTIRIPEGGIIYSENQYDAPSVMATVIVTGGEIPAPDYYPGELFTSTPVSGCTMDKLGKIAVMSPKLTSLYAGPESGNIKVLIDGVPVEAPYTLTPDEDSFNEAHVMWLEFAPAIEGPAKCTIEFPAQCFKVNKYPVTKYSAPFELKFDIDPTQGVADIDADDSAAEYYDLLGRRIATPEKGQLVIERRGAKVAKRIIR